MTVQNQYYLGQKEGYLGVMPWADKIDGKWIEIQKGL
jgi:hypothetical protein